MIIESVIAGTISAILGGAILAGIFFYLREKVFGPKNISGYWHFKNKTMRTAFNPFRDMELTFSAILFREGSKILGASEKIHENSVEQNRELVGKERVRGIVEGSYESRIFSSDLLHLHIREKGEIRESSTYITLKVNGDSVLFGNFQSFVADQDGSSKWQRKPFQF